LNIAHIITKLELGGAQKQLLSLITHLDKKRYNSSLITAQDGLLIKDALLIKDLRLKKSRFLQRSINPLKDFLALYEIYRFIKRNKVDIVHTHSSKAGILGRWAARLSRINPARGRTSNGVKIVVHTVHGWSFNEYQNCLWRKIIIWLEKFTARITDKLIVVSYHDLQKGLDNHIGYRDKYKLIRYGIDYEEFTSLDKNTRQDKTNYLTRFSKEEAGLREELGIDIYDLVVGMVSCFKPQKSPQDFIKLAFLVNKVIPRAKFLLVGDGVLRKEIERLISKFDLGQRVILTSWRQDIPRTLSAIDVFVLTSLWEGLPISVLEAMAASRPVVVTNTGGVAEIILEGRTGFLVSPGETKKMADKLNALLKDENLRRQIGQNAKGSLDPNFTLENMVRNTEDLYQVLIKKVGVENVN